MSFNSPYKAGILKGVESAIADIEMKLKENAVGYNTLIVPMENMRRQIGFFTNLNTTIREFNQALETKRRVVNDSAAKLINGGGSEQNHRTHANQLENAEKLKREFNKCVDTLISIMRDY